MRLLFDENLSPRLAQLLAADFPGSEHVRHYRLAAAHDQDVWNFASAQDAVIVSKDADFQHRALLYGAPPKVIWLRIGNGTTTEVVQLLCQRKADIAAFVADPGTSLLVLP